MAPIRFPGQTIESWNPAIDARALEVGRVLILDGKNYLFDSKGPKSGFGHRMVTGGAIGNKTDVQFVDVANQTLLATSKGLFRQEYAVPPLRDVLEPSTYYRQLTVFNEVIHNNEFNVARWHGAYLNGATFATNRNYGLWQINRTDANLHAVDGVPDITTSMAIVAGRLMLLSPNAVFWSGPGDGSDFNPQTGGAGFQLTTQYMADEPIGLTSTQKELVIWGRESAMTAEYIGGQAVFRWDALEMGLFPLGPMAITAYLQDSSFIMTKHGLAVVRGTQLDLNVSPSFNQFIRGMLNDNYSLEARLDYIKEDDLLYVQLADSQPYYSKTYVLAVSLDRWGSFDENHLGICRFGSTRGATGFADESGYLHKFTDTPDREVRGKGLIGLDSHIDVGYLNTPDMIQTADAALEIQEINVSMRKTFPSDVANLQLIDWQGDGTYWNVETGPFVDEDWNTGAVDTNIDEDWDDGQDSMVIDDDLNNEGEDYVLALEGDEGEEAYIGEDWNLGEIYPNEDYNLSHTEASAEDWNGRPLEESDDYLQPPMVSVWSGLDYEDWNLPDAIDGDEDWDGPYSFRNFITTVIQVYSSFDGGEYDLVFDPELAIERGDRSLYTTLTAGRFQFLRLKANARWDYYHLTQFDATVTYEGQYS